MPAGKVDVVITANGVQYTKTMQAAANAARQFGNANEQAGASTVHLVSRTQAASGAIRVLEGNLTNSVRAAENFLSRIPGVGAALQKAFPVVGAIALLGVVGELSKRVYDFIHTANEVPQKLQDAFQATNEAMRTSNDSLQSSIDKVKNEIAVLENRSPNLMAEALDRSRVEADKLAESLHKASNQFKALMKENKIGAFAGFVTNQASTSNTAGTVEYYQKQQADIADSLADAKDAGDKKQIATLQKQLEDSRASEQAWLQGDEAAQKTANGSTSWRNWGTKHTLDTSANQEIDTAALRNLRGEERDESETNTLDKANDQKDTLEAQKKADADRLKAMQEALAMEKAQYGISIAAELAFWSARISAFSKGSEQYKTVLMQTYALQADLYKEDLAVKKSYQEKQDSDSKDSEAILNASNAAVTKLMVQQANDVLHTGEAWKNYNSTVTLGAEIQTKNASALAEASVRMEEMTGKITKLGAAQQMSAIHAKAYADAMQALKNQQAQISTDGSLSAAQKATELQKNANQQSQLSGQYQVQQQQDQYTVSGATLAGATKNALDEMVASWQDMTHSLEENLERTMDSLNSDLARALIGQKGRHQTLGQTIGGTLDQSAEGLAKTGLQKLEGTVLGKFGLGPKKAPIGTANDPLYVKMTSSGVGSTSSTLGSITHGLSGMGHWVQGIFGGSSSSGGILSSLSHLFQGAFAGGGDVLANRPALIGEQGPELFVPSSAGRIMPNGSFGNTTHHYSIDARGSQDPAMTEAAVKRALHQTLHKAVSSSVSATREGMRRQPKNAGF